MLSAQQQAHLAVETCLQNLVQVGKQSLVFKDKYRISMDRTVRVALSFESWNIHCHATKAPNEHDGGKTNRNLDGK